MEITLQRNGRQTTMKNLYKIVLLLGFVGISQQAMNFKRHYVTTGYSDQATRSPRSDDPMCRNVCVQVREECSASCYPPKGTGHTAFSTTWMRGGTPYNVNKDDSKKYECIDKCLKDGDNPYVIPNSCDRPDDDEDDDDDATSEEAQPKAPSKSRTSSDAAEIELTTLTTKRRCQLPAYRNSTVCKFEDDDPDVAKKVFDANKPKLTLCTGGPVMSGKRGLYTRHTLKAFIDRQDQLRLSSEYEETFQNQDNNNDEEGTPSTPNRKKRTKRNSEQRRQKRSFTVRKRSSKKSREGKELCVTESILESPSRAIHRATEEVVDIYFYAGYSQWFEMGSCKHSGPIISVSVKDAANVRCGMAMTAHKAYIIIEPAKMKDAHKVKDCGTVTALDKKYRICHDWVYLPSHCKLFYS